MNVINDFSNEQLADYIYDFISSHKLMYKTTIVSRVLFKFGSRFSIGAKIYLEKRIRKAFTTLIEMDSIIYEPRKLVIINFNHNFPTLRSDYAWA